MNRDRIQQLTPDPGINAFLVDWVDGVKELLGDNVLGLYLTGSLAYGDFVPGRSDIDFQAVVRRPLSGDELAGIEKLHNDLSLRHPVWGRRSEGSYVPVDLMQQTMANDIHRPWWGFDRLHATALAGNEWLINHYFLSKHGIALDGPGINSFLPRIDIHEVRGASARDLFQEWEPRLDDAQWLSDPHQQSYLVLNICRILHTVLGAGPGSKRAAADWVAAAYPQWTDLIAEADRWQHGAQMQRAEDTKAFVRFAVRKVHESGILAHR